MKAVLALPMALLLALSVPALAKDHDKGDKGTKATKVLVVLQVLSQVRAFPCC
jgi:hypothetical protein